MIDYKAKREAIEAFGDATVQWFVSVRAEPEIPQWVTKANSVDQFTVAAVKGDRALLRGISSAYAALMICSMLDTFFGKDPRILLCLNPDGTDYGTTRAMLGTEEDPICGIEGEPIIPRLYEEYLAFFEPYAAEVDGETVTITPPPEQTGAGWELPHHDD